jgi:hypothetical protein
MERGFTRTHGDHNLYYLRQGRHIVLLILYVDDVFITGSDATLVAIVKTTLQQLFRMVDLGPIEKYLGVEFVPCSEGIFMHQSQYSTALFSEFGMQDCRPSPVPLPEGRTLVSETGTASVDPTRYRQIVGKLLYLTNTRPDLAYSVNLISRFLVNPQQKHLDSALDILRYVQATKDYGILYQKGQDINIQGYTDTDWGSCEETRRSTGGYIFTVGQASLTWSSKRQPTVSRSSTESEYKALSDGTQEAVWIRRLLLELGFLHKTEMPLNCSNSEILANLPKIPLHCDNQGSLKLARNPIFHARTKHIEIHHHFARKRLEEGEIDLDYIPTGQQPADILTKALGRKKFEFHRNSIGVTKIQNLHLNRKDKLVNPSFS